MGGRRPAIVRPPSRIGIRINTDDIMEASESVKSSDEAEQSDSILDSRSDKSDSKNSSDIEVDSEWSEADEIFGANSDELEEQIRRESTQAQHRYDQLIF